jgi:hypothetical protein
MFTFWKKNEVFCFVCLLYCSASYLQIPDEYLTTKEKKLRDAQEKKEKAVCFISFLV